MITPKNFHYPMQQNPGLCSLDNENGAKKADFPNDSENPLYPFGVRLTS
ncbi:MAG: hypothetical protein WCK35_10525 [Chloroflexota bacterium]